MTNLEKAIKSLRSGRMILLYDADDREGETDFVIPARSTSPEDIAVMRRDGGGLICVAISSEAAESLGLPFMTEILRHAAYNGNRALQTLVERDGDLKYDNHSSFSVWVNHKDTYTGITDNDRALTINKIGEMVSQVEEGRKIDFGSEFHSPGHVAILRAARGLLNERKGQTELSIALAQKAGITQAMVVCEMLDNHNGKALSKEKAREYAREHNLQFIEGKEITV